MNRYDVEKYIKFLKTFEDEGELKMVQKLSDYLSNSLKPPGYIQMNPETYLEFSRFIKDSQFRRAFEGIKTEVCIEEEGFNFILIDDQ